MSRAVQRGECITGCIIFVALGLVLVAGVVFTGISYHNSEVDLRNQIEAQQQKCEVIFDQVWKIISQQAQITEEHRDSFRDIYVDIMDARYQNGSGTLMSWIQEKNPSFDSKLFEKLMNTVEEQRLVFSREQTALISLHQQHKAMLQRFPGNVLLFNRKEVPIQLVTSSKTQSSFATGADDDVNLFKKDDKKDDKK
jgi:Na+-transporting NADH:ubiquinone oxidoreductase subunit NqrC